ncbi:MAG: polynucleotide adenylyltransferase PcnB [Gammaproteobacteria bacterium]|nr:polynucleotide adenylyltransferase PcnB [Gammaproteobacteria bacterium]MCD8542892.1 polynucleotide adenylyltransferase PcnB [Gammaproteobacteria bacterium]
MIIKTLLSRLFKKKKAPISLIDHQHIVPRSAHKISRSSFSGNALKVLTRLKSAGFQAYLVGGCVRDLLLDLKPKDFDVATNARPEEVKNLFTNCRLIGRRFRLAHVHFGRDIIEVATFRGSNTEDDSHVLDDTGMIKRDNVYGTLQEDIWRRDITVNALYYNIADFSIVDAVNGLSDLQHKIIRVIGDPEIRYREDPVRMLRVLRFAAKLGFTVETKSLSTIRRMSFMLNSISNARLFDEVYKLFHTGVAFQTFQLLLKEEVLGVLFPETKKIIAEGSDNHIQAFIEHACRNTDVRIQENKKVTAAFLFSVMLWHVYKRRSKILGEQMPKVQANSMAMAQVLAEQGKITAIPKALVMMIRDIWQLQYRLTKPINEKTFAVLEHPKFRAAYDFLLLRAEFEPEHQERAEWWTALQVASPVNQTQMLTEAIKKYKKTGHSRRKHSKLS